MVNQTRAQKMHARRESDARMEAGRVATRAAVAANKCPDCSRKLRRNLALTGWWQCEQFGAVTFRAEPSKPSCGWQGFTE